MTARLAIVCCAAALGAACASLHLDAGKADPAPDAAPGWAEARLIEAVSRAEAALTALAGVRAAEHPIPDTPIPDDVPPELRRRVTLDWIGPLETLAEALAAQAGYGFVTAGAPPVRPAADPRAARRRHPGGRSGRAHRRRRTAHRPPRLGTAGTICARLPGSAPGRAARDGAGKGRRLMPRRVFLICVFSAFLGLEAGIAFAGEAPPTLNELFAAEPSRELSATFAEDKRRTAMRIVALGFGARAGLARRGWEIAELLKRHAARLSTVYRFEALMLNAGGFTVMPPVLAGTTQAFRPAPDGTRAAAARRILRIAAPARIVSAAPGWRDFLVRAWLAAEPPVSVLFPRDDDETRLWRRWLAEGWAHGTALADDIFAADLDRLTQVFEGLVLWRRAHLARMVSAPGIETERAGAAQPRCSGVARPPDRGYAMTGDRDQAMGWDEAAFAFPPAGLDRFLLWAADRGASDIAFQTGSPAFVEIDGILRRATGAVLDGLAMARLAERIYDATADGILRSGRAIDCSYAVACGRNAHRRFHCNLSAVLAGHGFGVNITMRVLPDAPRGLTLVTGVPGSGKSTLLAAGTRRLLERGAGRVQSYEAPIEYVFDGIAGDGALMSSSEVPRHFASFAEGLRASLRRRTAAVIVGEARDRETVEAALGAADFGIAVYATAHTIGVAATIRRLLAEFPHEERDERGAALADVLNLVVTQMLLPNPRGGRTAIREWLAFDPGLKAALLEAPQARWPAIIGQALAKTGNHLAAAATRARRAGRIHEADRRRVVAAASGDVRSVEPC